MRRRFSPSTGARIRASWLGPDIERHVEWLRQRGYDEATIVHRTCLVLRFGHFAQERGVESRDELPQHVDAFVRHWGRRGSHRTEHARHCMRLLVRKAIEEVLWLALPGFRRSERPRRPWPFADSAPGFRSFLREERGLRPETVNRYGHYLRGLATFMERQGIGGLAELSPAWLTAFMVDQSRRMGCRSLSGCAAVVRAFLRYARREGLVVQDLARSVDRPRIYRLSTLPRSISSGDAERLLGTIARSDARGRRDYAMLLLLLTYGLRAREVAALTLDDIDWRHERLHVPMRKGGHSHVYPLTPAVGEAIIDYLRHDRPRVADRRVFFVLMAPCRPVGHHNVSRRASVWLRRAGIQVLRPGSHTLRHTCVQRLVDAGFGFKAIGDFVGHRSPHTTQIYGKVSIDKLREVALARGEGAL